MSYLGMTLFVILEPLGGHLTLLRLLIETFETLPLGAVVVGRSAIELIGGLTQQSFILAIRVAAPLMVMMTLIDLTLGFLGHSVPQINVQAVGYAVRASLCLLILVVLLSAIPEQISVFIPQLFDDLHTVIVQGRT
jgi:flagellar biosynthetic protein FliR